MLLYALYLNILAISQHSCKIEYKQLDRLSSNDVLSRLSSVHENH